MNRRRFLTLSGTVGATALAGCTLQPKRQTPVRPGPQVALDPLVEGVDFPTDFEFMPNGDGLVLERTGRVLRHPAGSGDTDPFLDVSGRMVEMAGERGLLGLALHPDFAENRRFFLRYSAPLRDGMPSEYSHTSVLSEFRANGDFTGASLESEQILLEIPQPGDFHNAGDLVFGPDGLLYASIGDGGGYDTAEDEDWYWWNDKGETAQNTRDNLLGGILRIDVDSSSEERPYGIPSDNPLVGTDGRDEYYAWGFRNPFRMSFDEGRLFVGDVGLRFREEINIVERGGNYGWSVKEGTSCAHTVNLREMIGSNPLNVFHPRTLSSVFQLLSPVLLCPDTTDSGELLREPIIEYTRPASRAVIGGYVYRGEALPELAESYVFGDYAPPAPLYRAVQTGPDRWIREELEVVGTETGRLPGVVNSFAQDADGELYVVTTGFGEGAGRVDRLISPE